MIDVEAEQAFAIECIAREAREEGVVNTLISLVKKGLLTVKDAATQANMTENDFKALMPI